MQQTFNLDVRHQANFIKSPSSNKREKISMWKKKKIKLKKSKNINGGPENTQVIPLKFQTFKDALVNNIKTKKHLSRCFLMSLFKFAEK
ncbi:hypothetical protein AN396_04040 [Candidatus Epulonipiscium fishelsonii]|uniref:Uncharacterized protein n=1 Tax=Candidatus Epulonipiscium fishelsonii TaxID=77094 RepID=A0ACC8XE08_9FIRM|nr:hypothetical protein AN396_04040 [Epulopiscium sp. SCG-B11WGA-EpuloA1]